MSFLLGDIALQHAYRDALLARSVYLARFVAYASNERQTHADRAAI